MKLLICICAAVIVVFATHVRAAEPEVKADDLPRVKPTEPADALKTFQVRKGFRIELVAAEPLVVDPIAMSFDENGRLFVIEMRDYSERRAEKLGRIKMLEDTNSDGKIDKATVFLENLAWPTALMWINGGLLVGAAPDLIFAKDTNNDGVADDIQTLYTGFGSTQGEKLNVQGLFNNLNWGLDNRIHGCSGHDGGLVNSTIHPSTQPFDVRNKDFVLNPLTWDMHLEAGGGQYGLSFNQFGDRFTCSNSSHCEVFMFDAKYAARNPHYTPPNPRVSIAADGPAAEVFRISPEEPWRVIRTRWRIAGIVPGQIEGGGRSAGYFTGATGITVYRGSAFPRAYVGDTFTGDAGGNLIHHKRVRRQGLDFIAQRPDDEKRLEFVASTDNWFRPVNFANAPDGTLYVADMYRETIEHPWSLPPSIKKFLDLNSGNDRGRIYRIVPDDYVQPEPPRLGQAMTSELVATLEHPNGWHRDTAQRLLVERQDKTAIPMLSEMVETSVSPLGRLHALHTLDGLNALTEQHVLGRMSDDPTVRAHAIRLSERFLSGISTSVELSSKLESLTSDPDITVRYQLAFALGQVRHPARNAALTRILQRDIANPWIQTAALTSLQDGAHEVFQALVADPAVLSAKPSRALFTQLLAIVGATHDPDEVAGVMKTLTAMEDDTLRFALARGLAEGASRAGKHIDWTNALYDRAAKVASDERARTGVRLEAIRFLGFSGDGERAPAVLAPVLDSPSPTLQSAAITALDQLQASALPKALFARWSTLKPDVKRDAIATLLAKTTGAAAMLDAIGAGAIPAGDLTASQVNFLRNHGDSAVRQLAQKTLVPPTTNRSTLVESFRPALSLTGDAARGKTLYQQRCISCHRAEGEGFNLGPDLVTMRNAGKEKLLTNILDPNREVAANSIAYLVETKQGESILGLITSDTQASITLRQAYGRETVIGRDKIKRMTSDKKSLMPEGLEAGLKPQDVADLIEFVMTAR